MIEEEEKEETPPNEAYIEEYFEKIEKISKRRQAFDTFNQKMRNLTYNGYKKALALESFTERQIDRVI